MEKNSMKTSPEQQELVVEADRHDLPVPQIRETNALAVQEAQPTTPMSLLALALSNGAAIEVIERLSALQEKAQDRDAEVQFNLAMNAAQAEIVRVAPDLTNPQTNSKYASYPTLDRKIRPVYIRHGFSLSFNTESPLPEVVRVLCYVAHKDGHTRTSQVDMPADGKGAKGNDVMTKTHAAGSAMQYGMRYLLKLIFNVSVGVDDDGNSAGGVPIPEEIQVQALDAIANCNTMQELMAVYKTAYKIAADNNDQGAMKAYIAEKDRRKAELQKGGQ
jgi:hypothetical protein